MNKEIINETFQLDHGTNKPIRVISVFTDEDGTEKVRYADIWQHSVSEMNYDYFSDNYTASNLDQSNLNVHDRLFDKIESIRGTIRYNLAVNEEIENKVESAKELADELEKVQFETDIVDFSNEVKEIRLMANQYSFKGKRSIEELGTFKNFYNRLSRRLESFWNYWGENESPDYEWDATVTESSNDIISLEQIPKLNKENQRSNGYAKAGFRKEQFQKAVQYVSSRKDEFSIDEVISLIENVDQSVENIDTGHFYEIARSSDFIENTDSGYYRRA